MILSVHLLLEPNIPAVLTPFSERLPKAQVVVFSLNELRMII